MEILAADIGGTSSRFARFTLAGGTLALHERVTLGTRDAGSFAALIDNLRASGFGLMPGKADATVLAVAGPVERDGLYSNPPLIDWDIDLAALGMGNTLLINDFVAQAYACLTGPGQSAEVILKGRPGHAGAIAVFGAGTGLGKAVLVPDGSGGYIAMPSEGGHASFPFRGAREREYEDFLLLETGDAYMTYNAVVSGGGLSHLHRFLTGETLGARGVVERLADDSRTLAMAARFYARCARNFALETLCLGGLYIAGGVAARSPAIVRASAFAEEFTENPKHSALLSRIPVYLIADELSGLWGAAYRASLFKHE